MIRENFRKKLIDAMCASGNLKSNELGEGYADWHNDNNECGVTFILKDGQKFDVVISVNSL